MKPTFKIELTEHQKLILNSTYWPHSNLGEGATEAAIYKLCLHGGYYFDKHGRGFKHFVECVERITDSYVASQVHRIVRTLNGPIIAYCGNKFKLLKGLPKSATIVFDCVEPPEWFDMSGYDVLWIDDTLFKRVDVRPSLKQDNFKEKQVNQFKVGDRVEWCYEADFEKYGNSKDSNYHDFGVVTKVYEDVVYCNWDSGRNTVAQAKNCRLVEKAPDTIEQDINNVIKRYCQEIMVLLSEGRYEDAKVCSEGLSAILKTM